MLSTRRWGERGLAVVFGDAGVDLVLSAFATPPSRRST
jgi:hypothetical protein